MSDPQSKKKPLITKVDNIILFLKAQDLSFRSIIGIVIRDLSIAIWNVTHHFIINIIPIFFITYIPILFWISIGYGLIIYPSWMFKFIGFSIIFILIFSLFIFITSFYETDAASAIDQGGAEQQNGPSGQSNEEEKLHHKIMRFFQNTPSYTYKLLNKDNWKDSGEAIFNLFLIAPSYIYIFFLSKNDHINNVIDNAILSFLIKSWEYVAAEPFYFLIGSIYDCYHSILSFFGISIDYSILNYIFQSNNPFLYLITITFIILLLLIIIYIIKKI